MFCVSVYLVLNKSVNYGILDNNGLKRTEGKHKNALSNRSTDI